MFKTRRGTYGCLYSYGRARRLDPDESGGEELQQDAYGPFGFAGPYVAYVLKYYEPCAGVVCNWTEVAVVDLRPTKRRLLMSRYAASDETRRPFRQHGAINAEAFVTDVALQPSGSVAWIECEGHTQGPCDPAKKKQTSVLAATHRKARRKLDEGADIAKHSLTAAGGRFHWRSGGRTRSGVAP